jgi:hypothetical protein
MTNLQVSNSITFEEAIALTESLLEQMSDGKLNDSEIQNTITELVKTENGARGFFVTYLTSDRTLADNPSSEVVEALKTSPEIISELLAKNLAMSSAMAVTHRRNNDEESAKGSDLVCQRTRKIVQKMPITLVLERIKEIQESAATGQGKYITFLKRWGYDEEQKQVIQKTLSEVMP